MAEEPSSAPTDQTEVSVVDTPTGAIERLPPITQRRKDTPVERAAQGREAASGRPAAAMLSGSPLPTAPTR